MSEFPSGSTHNEIEKQTEAEPEMVNRYVEYAKKEQEKVEVLELTEDKAVRIKLKGQEEMIFKSPEEMFYLGWSAGEKNEKDLTFINKHSGGKEYPLFIQFDYAVHGGPSYNQFSSKESRFVLKTDINNGYILATKTADEELMAYFFDVDFDAEFVIDYDKKLCEIKDKDFSEEFRILYFARGMQMSARSKLPEYIERIDQLEKEDPAFIDKFLDFAVRYCLTSGHERSDGLFDFLIKRPNLEKRMSRIHRYFSLPYLLERDYYRKMLIFPGNEEEDLKKIKQIVETLNIDIAAIRKRLADSGNPREFMSKF